MTFVCTCNVLSLRIKKRENCWLVIQLWSVTRKTGFVCMLASDITLGAAQNCFTCCRSWRSLRPRNPRSPHSSGQSHHDVGYVSLQRCTPPSQRLHQATAPFRSWNTARDHPLASWNFDTQIDCLGPGLHTETKWWKHTNSIFAAACSDWSSSSTGTGPTTSSSLSSRMLLDASSLEGALPETELVSLQEQCHALNTGATPRKKNNSVIWWSDGHDHQEVKPSLKLHKCCQCAGVTKRTAWFSLRTVNQVAKLVWPNSKNSICTEKTNAKAGSRKHAALDTQLNYLSQKRKKRKSVFHLELTFRPTSTLQFLPPCLNHCLNRCRCSTPCSSFFSSCCKVPQTKWWSWAGNLTFSKGWRSCNLLNPHKDLWNTLLCEVTDTTRTRTCGLPFLVFAVFLSLCFFLLFLVFFLLFLALFIWTALIVWIRLWSCIWRVQVWAENETHSLLLPTQNLVS